jgi:hypothetical protein
MKKLLLFLIALTASVTLVGQITTGSFNGRIVDSNNEPLIGATVSATHVPSGSLYGTVTNENGYYTIPAVRVGGPYSIEVGFVGFEANSKTNIFTSLGTPNTVNFIMSEGVVIEELVVTSTREAQFDDSKTGSALNITKEKINALPTVSRNINDFTRLTPQSNGNSFAGTNSRFNNYTIDGNIYNNNFGLGSAQFAGGNPISLDAIEAVSVNLAPYDVRYSGFTGASVNAVTRSGTNNFEGSVYHYYRNDQMLGNKAGDLSVDRGNSENKIWGARIGGPIIKNKLFFFASYEKESQATPGLLKTALRPGQTPDGLTISRVPLSEAEFVRESIESLYGYDVGAPDSYDFSSEQERMNFRLDYNIHKNHKFSLRFNNYSAFTDVPTNGNSIRYISTRYRNTSRTGVENINFRNNNYTNDRTVRSWVGELNSIVTPNISNQFNVGYTSITDPKRGIPGGQDFPFIEVLEPDASGNLLYYMTMGNELFTVGNLLENNILNITNNTTWYKGNHTITGGVNLEYMTFDNAFNPTFNAFYRYIGYDNFVDAVINKNPNVYPDAFAKGYALDGSTTPPTDNTKFGQFGIYIQDEYQMSDRLKITGGLRIDIPFYPIDLPNNTLLDALGKTFTDVNGDNFSPDVTAFPSAKPLFSPRIGFNYDANGDRSLTLRGGTGVFTGRIPFVWLSNQVNGSGVIRGGIGYEGQEVVDAGIVFNPDVTSYNPENPAISLSNELNLTDKDFRLPQVWRTNIGVDYKLPYGIQASVELMYNRDISTPIAYNPVLRAPDVTMNGPDKRGVWTSNYSNDSDFRNVFYLTNATDKADYMAATIQLSKYFEDGLYAMVAYTKSRANDLDAANGSQAISLWPVTVQNDRNRPELGIAGFDQPNRMIGNLSYTTESTTLGVFYQGGEAGRFSYTYSGNFGDASDRLMYVPNNGSELNFQAFTVGGVEVTAAQQAQLLDAYIDQDPYLSGVRGQVSERNGAKNPWVHRFDFRILQDIKFAAMGNNKFQISLDFLNIGNMFNSEWGVPQVANQRNLLTYRGLNSNNEPEYRLNTIPGTSEFPSETYRYTSSVLTNVWQMQVGVRYIFE